MKKLLLAGVLVGLMVSGASANVIFTFTEVGDDVVMTSSGSLDTSKLVSANWYSGAPNGSWASGGWVGTGVQSDDDGYDIMGSGNFVDNRNGPQKRFRFSTGTDISAIANPGGPFSDASFDWVVTGTKSFVTYGGYASSVFQAGIQVVATDIDVNGFWTPDQTWENTGGSFASLGLNVGSYSVSDKVTGETITIQVASVPDGGLTALLLGLSSLALAGVRRLVA
jgi:hypothetical protein